MTVADLVSKLSRPMFVWRMARADRETASARRGAATRREDAEIQMDRIVLAYAADRIMELAAEKVRGTGVTDPDVQIAQLDGPQIVTWLRAPTLPEVQKASATAPDGPETDESAQVRTET